MSDRAHHKAKAVRLREQGWQYAQIAEMLGVGRTTVYRWCNPAKVAGYEQKRRQAKEAWHRENYKGVCAICGGDTSARDQPRCVNCRLEADRERHRVLLDQVADLYNAGMSLADIARTVGHKPSPGALGRELNELRAEGRIGWRLGEARRRNMREARWGAAA